jgi:hypothetical protein
MLIDTNTNLAISSVVILLVILIISVILFRKGHKKPSVIFTIVSLIAVTLFFFFLAFYKYKPANKERKKNGVIKPFAARLTPDWGSSASSENGLEIVKYTNNDKTLPLPAIECSAGYGIDIISAYLEVDDPYNECSVIPDPLFQVTCGYIPTDYKGVGDCTTDKDCSIGTVCNLVNTGVSKNKCIPKTCTASSDCTGSNVDSSNMRACSSKLGTLCDPLGDKGTENEGIICVAMVNSSGGKVYVSDPAYGSCMSCIDTSSGKAPVSPKDGVCVLMPDCMNVNNSGIASDGLNNTCSAKGFHEDEFKCRPRDASAYLANYCNGKHSCLGGSSGTDSSKWLPNIQDGAFGPLPCLIESGTDDYKTLPITTGQNPDPKDNTGGSYNQGYKVHGLYSCVLKDAEAE